MVIKTSFAALGTYCDYRSSHTSSENAQDVIVSVSRLLELLRRTRLHLLLVRIPTRQFFISLNLTHSSISREDIIYWQNR